MIRGPTARSRNEHERCRAPLKGRDSGSERAATEVVSLPIPPQPASDHLDEVSDAPNPFANGASRQTVPQHSWGGHAPWPAPPVGPVGAGPAGSGNGRATAIQSMNIA